MTDSENNPPKDDQDYLDVSEFGSDVDQDVDLDKHFDEDNDEGIFAPSKNDKKKKISPVVIIGVVILVLVVGGGVFYLTKSADAPVSMPVKIASTTEIPPVTSSSAPEIAKQEDGVKNEPAIPGVPTPASDFTKNNTPPSIQAPEIPNSSSDPSIKVVEKTESVAQAVPNAIAPDVPAIPSVPSDHASTLPSEVSKTSEIVPPGVKTVTEDMSAQPDPSGLIPGTKPNVDTAITPEAPTEDELEAAREKINVKKKPEAKTVYFDAPKGKALTDMPPPSINPMREPGESIIIVSRGKRLTEEKSQPENVVVEKGESNAYVESKLIAANRATALGMNDAALDFYNELYKKNPRDPRILMGRAVALQKAGDTQKAIEMYEQLLDIKQNNPEAITNLMGLLGKTQPAVALQNLLELRQKYPNNPSVAAQLGVAYAGAGNLQDGLKYLNMAAGLEPKNPMHPFNMAVICEKLNDRGNAIKYYEQALDVYSLSGVPDGGTFSRDVVYDRLAHLRGN